jgi:hypothetical protein
MANTILPGFDEAASSYSLEWLNRRGAELMLGEAIERIGAESVLLKSGRELEADVVCAHRSRPSPLCPSLALLTTHVPSRRMHCQLQVRWGDAEHGHAQGLAVRGAFWLQKLDRGQRPLAGSHLAIACKPAYCRYLASFANEQWRLLGR